MEALCRFHIQKVVVVIIIYYYYFAYHRLARLHEGSGHLHLQQDTAGSRVGLEGEHDLGLEGGCEQTGRELVSPRGRRQGPGKGQLGQQGVPHHS